ncbi:rho guanine nucleotide exchange factor 18 [Bactrocera neohumeralis]|uniref:rho guanine nucleotide exchange factor 18 n=1 Tax=Bactrocera tryoni TaxID=59916 RepID=UPI001A977348|nr:rho guanine nucleotide exchange factor 18 [Bactrocera tryoni]XP_050338365.1 rho guanine nucleotide exchange factor 18 [Bactrocera neohumeralis]
MMAAVDNDSDNDVVTDFVNYNPAFNTDLKHSVSELNVQIQLQNTKVQHVTNHQHPSSESQNYCIPIIDTAPVLSASNSCNNNMIPTINVTPHSPASITKFNNIFEDTLTQLQSIRETVVQMKNCSARMHDGFNSFWPVHSAILSASLPDLNSVNSANVALALGQYVRWMPRQQQYVPINERRRSWTTIDDLNITNKSISLSSLDSEEPETICATDQRRRSARNSTGGISTHSLNEAELARDFQRIAAKRSLATEIRIPLQKSISTSSIVAKEEIKSRHLYDSEDENQSLLRAHVKIEAYDNVEKRRKRGSLFFRKKKDKNKMKSGGQTGVCDSCGINISTSNIKEHQMECKVKKSGSSSGQKLLLVGVKKGADKTEIGQDYFDGVDQSGNINDDTPLIRSEFLNDPPIEAQDLGADPILGIAADEHDSWSPSVPRDVIKSLKEKQIKRQEHIYEFIMTEKHHCQTLLVMQKVFVESLERHFPSLNINTMFPRLSELTELHINFLKKLRQKQREQYVVDSIADILLDFFSLEKAQHLRLAYGEFCANHRTALEHFKTCMTSRDQTFAEWYKHCLANPLLKKKGIPECVLFVTQRLTKYPLLIEPLLKSGREDKLEADKLQHALNLVKALLIDVDACVAEKELRERQMEIFNRVDPKSFAIYKNKPFRKSDIGAESRRRLKFEGYATLMQGRSKMQLVLVVVLTDCLFFLCENSAHNKYTFFTPEHKAGVVPLQKLLIREKAGTEARGIYIISSNPSFPEMYELKVQQPKDKNTWIQSIRQSVLECPSSDVIESEDLTAEEKLRIGVSKRDLIDKIRQKDIDHAILLEDKIYLQLNLLKEQKNFFEVTTTYGQSCSTHGGNGTFFNGSSTNASNFLATFGSYKDLVGVDCNTIELWKYVLNMVQSISQLAAMVYTASTGLPVSRSVSSVGEKQSDSYASPTLPKRAETFAGFDEKRGKGSFSYSNVSKIPALQTLIPRLQELEEKGDPKSSSSVVTLNIQSIGSDSQSSTTLGTEDIAIKDHNYAALQISHHLHTLLCIVSQQMTVIQNLQLQLALYRESPRVAYTHNDQLEELRNLQDKLQDEKTAWLRQKEQQEKELEEKYAQQIKLQEQIKAEQEDIKQQREQLYRKMELLSNQGLLLSPNTPLLINSPSLAATSSGDDAHDSHEGAHLQSDVSTPSLAQSTVDRRKDKWRTASTISKNPPVNLLSATNAPKINPTCIKQKFPMKLSSLSTSTSLSSPNSGSSKIDKSASFNASVLQQAGCTQILPLKLADKRSTTTQSTSQIVSNHARTGSSPAIIQHPNTRTATSPPLSTVSISRTDSSSALPFCQRQTPTSSRSSQAMLAAENNCLSSIGTSNLNRRNKNNNVKPDEEEIYF